MAIIVGLIVLACVIVLIGVALRVSAAILRGAVGLTNAVLGGRELHEDDYRRASYDYNPVPRPKSLAGLRVPMPGVGYAILINLGSGVASTVAQFLAMIVIAAVVSPVAGGPAAGGAGAQDPFDPELIAAGGVAVILGGLLAGLFVSLLVLKMALPTTFVRAGFVMVFQLLISVVLAVVLGLGVGLLSGIQVSDVQNAKPTGGGGGWVR